MQSKICTKCQIEKPLTEFYRHYKHKDGHAYDCKVCHKITVRQYRQEHPEKTKEYFQRYYKKKYQDPEYRRQILDKNIAYNKSHKKKILEQARKRRFKKAGKAFIPKTFVFYRDVICHWMERTLDVTAGKWKQLLSLPLTPKQRRIVELAMQGVTVSGAATLLGKQQSTITKTWNGDNNTNGGIYAKVRKLAPNLLENNG